MLKIKSISTKKNVFWNLINHFSSLIILLFFFPFLIKYLGPSNYGFFIFLGTINGIANIANFGFGEATLRYVALNYTKNEIIKIKDVLTTSLIIYCILGLIVGLSLYFCAPFFTQLIKEKTITNSESTLLIRISIISFLIRFSFGVFPMIPQAFQRYDISSKISMSESLLRIILFIGTIYYGFGLVGLVFSELIIALYYVFINYIVSAYLFKKIYFIGTFSNEILKQISGYSLYAALTQIIGLLWQYSDRLLIGYFIGSAAIAYFSIPQQIIFKVLSFVAAGSSVLFPKFSVDNINEQIKILYKKFTTISLFLTIILFSTIAYVISDFCYIWISPEFAHQSKNIAIILAVSCMVRGAFPIYENLFKGIGKPKYNLYVIIGSSSIIVILDLILIPMLGLKGAGIAYLISPIIGVLTIYLIYKKIFKESIIEPVILYVLPLIIGYLCLMFFFYINTFIKFKPSWILIICKSIIFATFIIFSLWFYIKLIVKSKYHFILSNYFSDFQFTKLKSILIKK